MRLRLPGPEPRNVSPEAVFATPMRLGLSNVSSQCVFAFVQGVFAMRLRHPMRLRLPCNRLRVPMRLHNASAPPNVSAPIKPFLDECVLAMRLHLQVVCHTPPGRRNVCSV